MRGPYSQTAPEHSPYFERDMFADQAKSAVDLPRRYRNPPQGYSRSPFGSNEMAVSSYKTILPQSRSRVPSINHENALTEPIKGRTSHSTTSDWKKDHAVSRVQFLAERTYEPPSPVQRRNVFQRCEFRITGQDTKAQHEVRQRSMEAQNSRVVRRKPVPVSTRASEGSSYVCTPKRALGQSFCRKNDPLSAAAATVLGCWPVIRGNLAEDGHPVEWRETPERRDARIVHQTTNHPPGMKSTRCVAMLLRAT